MIKEITFKHYRKLQNFTLNFSKKINVISGENGTCKSSILHIVSNSFKKVNSNHPFIKDDLLNAINQLNHKVNPKVYSLTKGDKKENSPVPPGFTGGLLTVKYFDDNQTLEFRKHKYPPPRYSLKPYYPEGGGESLPELMIIYLGLSRLVPVGEISDTEELSNTVVIPKEYEQDIIDKYYELTGILIERITSNEIKNLKSRCSFKTNREGIDSNTVSAGEDNLLILLTAIYSLKHYYKTTEGMHSILLIDELDATLHPSLQYEIFYLLEEISQEYGVQVFFTTHSLSLLELAIKNNSNITYLMDEIDSVYPMEKPDIRKIKLFLEKKTQASLYENNKIPLMTEDKEAREFLRLIFDFYSTRDNFSEIISIFDLIDINLGKNNLKDIFKNESLSRTLQAICILDGDDSHDYKKNILTLPGKDNPEIIAFTHFKKLLDKKEFWRQSILISNGYNISLARKELLPEIDNLLNKRDREKAKNLFNKHKFLFLIILKDWLTQEENLTMLSGFYHALYGAFRKVALAHKIDPNCWFKQ